MYVALATLFSWVRVSVSGSKSLYPYTLVVLYGSEMPHYMLVQGWSRRTYRSFPPSYSIQVG